jgi:hypothetical protein
MRGAISLVLLSLLSQAAGAAEAQSPPAREPLSKDELRACIQREEELGDSREKLRALSAAHKAEGARLSAEAVALSRVLRKLDDNDAAAVDAYNQRNQARNEAVRAHNNNADAYEISREHQKTAEADFMLTCASRPFMGDDEKAVLEELGLEKRRFDRDKEKPAATRKPAAPPSEEKPRAPEPAKPPPEVVPI